ncbi:MAG: non-hydrolyzing UDP-N-acetylglucosamine 2-epimerase [Candidatus Kryptoniota bacterium]
MDKKIKIITVVGTRPNFIKAAPLHLAFLRYQSVRHIIVHTGQHYDDYMSNVFFKDLRLPEPDIYLNVGSGTHSKQTAEVMVGLEKVLNSEFPDLVIVLGDVNSTMAAALAAVKSGIRVAHIEAGLRSFDRSMPEEINRIVTDAVSDLFFVTEESGINNLRREGADESKIFFVGNIMIDSLVAYEEKALTSTIREKLGLINRKYFLMTLHRASNVDRKENLIRVLEIIERVSKICTVVYPVHPRTKKMIFEFSLENKFNKLKNVVITEPLGYLDFLNLEIHATGILTDSGGMQAEATHLNVPCITLRENTEQPITIEKGTSVLAGLDANIVYDYAVKAFEGRWKKSGVPPLWDGRTAERIAEIVLQRMQVKQTSKVLL